MKQLPNMVSLRTQYVRLFVRDETTDPPKIAFVDYGLYTQVEQVNRAYLRNHYLDPDGQLYKATFFEFFRYPDQIRLADDPLYDELAFSRILEIKGNKDHTKLIQMLDDVNNTSIPIEQTFEKHFNKENYFTWMAFNILMGNLDTQSQNFMLYSPRNGSKWYFLPWDYDGDLGRQWQDQFFPYDKFEYGVANYWGVPLHNRVLKVARYREMLDRKVNELMKFLTPDRLNGMLNSYRKVTDVFALQMPDLYYLRGGVANYERTYETLPDEIRINYDLYRESLESPMPYFLDTPKASGTKLVFNWGESYDFNAQNITYQLQVAKDWKFEEVIFTQKLMDQHSTEIDMLAPGTYFWMVTSTNENGKTQYPFNVYIDADGQPHSGMKYLFITSDGKVLEE
jgi:spore coat protein H